jgi:hypothetical protein
VRFTAESRCSEPGGFGDWCEVRVLINGVEAEPAASSFPPDTFAFDSPDNTGFNQGETVNSWEGHAMDRHLCVRNDTLKTIWVPVQVQWKVTNLAPPAQTRPSFWIDDWSLTVEAALARCKDSIADKEDEW